MKKKSESPLMARCFVIVPEKDTSCQGSCRVRRVIVSPVFVLPGKLAIILFQEPFPWKVRTGLHGGCYKGKKCWAHVTAWSVDKLSSSVTAALHRNRRVPLRRNTASPFVSQASYAVNSLLCNSHAVWPSFYQRFQAWALGSTSLGAKEDHVFPFLGSQSSNSPGQRDAARIYRLKNIALMATGNPVSLCT